MIFHKNVMIESSASLSDIRCDIIILSLWKQLKIDYIVLYLLGYNNKARAKWELGGFQKLPLINLNNSCN